MAGSNLAVHFNFVFPVEVLVVRICVRLHLRRNKLYQVPHFIFLQGLHLLVHGYFYFLFFFVLANIGIFESCGCLVQMAFFLP